MIKTQRAYKILQENIQNARPFSLLRYGDGEYLFARHSESPNLSYIRAANKHWMHVPPIDSRRYIHRSIIDSFQHSNMVGLHDTATGGLWSASVDYFKLERQAQKLVSAEIHIRLEKEGYLHKLLKNQKVFYISCRNVDDYLLKECRAARVDKIQIYPQAKFETEFNTDKSFYLHEPAIREKIRQMDLKGWICLLGAGVAGKYLGIVMKEQGAVVIDAGSLFDLWANKITRTWIKDHLSDTSKDALQRVSKTEKP